MLTEKQKKHIIETINIVFDCPRAIKVVKENDKYVYVSHENGDVSEWEKSDVLPPEDLK